MSALKDYDAAHALELASANKAVIIDIRTSAEIAQMSIQIAAKCPMDLERLSPLECAKIAQNAAGDKEMILMCHSGARSKYLQNEFCKMGINCANFAGGIIAALAAGAAPATPQNRNNFASCAASLQKPATAPAAKFFAATPQNPAKFSIFRS